MCIIKKWRWMLLLVFIGLYGCVFNDDSEKGEKKLHADTVLKQVRLAIDPGERLKFVKSVESCLTRQVESDGDRPEILSEEKFNYTFPEDCVLSIDTNVINNESSEFSVRYTLKDGQLKYYKNDKTVDVSGEKEQRLKGILFGYLDELLLSVFAEPEKLDLDPEMYDVGGYQCRRLKVAGKCNPYIKTPHNIEYYVDKENYLIRKVYTDFSVITDIEYKDFDGVNLPCKYTMKNKHGDWEKYKVTKFKFEEIPVKKPEPYCTFE